MIFNFEITNLETMQIFRLEQPVKQKMQVPVIWQLQKRVLLYLFEREMIKSVSEISTKVGTNGDIVTMNIIGDEAERFFVKIKADKGGEGDEGSEKYLLNQRPTKAAEDKPTQSGGCAWNFKGFVQIARGKSEADVVRGD